MQNNFELKGVRPEAIPKRGTEEYKRFQLLLKYLPRWQSNNSPDDLGIVRFGFDCFPNTLKKEYKTAGWVRPSLYETLRFKPGYKKIDRANAICTYRDGSKSTWYAKILPIYLHLVGFYGVYFREHMLPTVRFSRIRGVNQDKSEEKLNNITVEIVNNPILINLFGELKPTFKEIKDKKMKNQAKVMMIRRLNVADDGADMLQAVGLNCPSRGANIFDIRPDFDLDDDVENKDNTKSDTQRQYNADEILGEQFGGLSDDGLTAYIANYVHKDCIIAHLMNNPNWHKEFHTIVKRDGMGKEYSDWPERFTVAYVHRLEEFYRSHPEMGGWKRFRLEYFNEIVSAADYKFKTFSGEYERKQNRNYIVINEPNHPSNPKAGLKTYHNSFIVIAGDPAISTNVRSSNAVASAVAFCDDMHRRVIDCRVGKFDVHDRFIDERIAPKLLAQTPEELGNVYMRGIVEEIARMVVKYNADAWVMEIMGQQRGWYNECRVLLDKLGYSKLPNLPFFTNEEKKVKLEFGLMNYFSVGWYEVLETLHTMHFIKSEVSAFGSGTMDALDSFFNAEQLGAHNVPATVPIASAIARPPKNRFEEDEDIFEGTDPWVVAP